MQDTNSLLNGDVARNQHSYSSVCWMPSSQKPNLGDIMKLVQQRSPLKGGCNKIHGIPPGNRRSSAEAVQYRCFVVSAFRQLKRLFLLTSHSMHLYLYKQTPYNLQTGLCGQQRRTAGYGPQAEEWLTLRERDCIHPTERTSVLCSLVVPVQIWLAG